MICLEIKFKEFQEVIKCEHKEEDIELYLDENHNSQRFCTSCRSDLNPHGKPITVA